MCLWILRGQMYCSSGTVDAFIRYLEKSLEMQRYMEAHQAVWILSPPVDVYKSKMSKKLGDEHCAGQQGKRLDRGIEKSKF